MINKTIGYLFQVILGFFLTSTLSAEERYHFVTSTDTEHYAWTLNLIGSIHQYHDDNLGQIAVFDLGLTSEERSYLNSLSHVKVFKVEKTNPHIFQKFEVDKKGKIARGWYSWKPVVIKQALEMFPEFFYLDSGVSLLGPMDLLFKHLHENGYFFVDCGHSIGRMTIKPLIEKFALNDPQNQWILDKKGISAGVQGISKAIYKSYVLPLYELSHDIANFEDDGSCAKGFGFARHDQTLFSIQARLQQYKVHEVLGGGKLKLKINNKEIKTNLEDFLEITRGNFDPDQTKSFLRFKK